MSGIPTSRGAELNETWEVNAKHPLYHEHGRWYMPLERFPGALFDSAGYVIFNTEAESRSCPALRIRTRVNGRGGISSLPGYRRVAGSAGVLDGRRAVQEGRR